jgi:hypothetical protein
VGQVVPKVEVTAAAEEAPQVQPAQAIPVQPGQTLQTQPSQPVVKEERVDVENIAPTVEMAPPTAGIVQQVCTHS